MSYIYRESRHQISLQSISNALFYLLINLNLVQAGFAQNVIDDLFYAQEFCGEPAVDPDIDAGVFIWQDCGSSISSQQEHWFIKLTAGGSSANQTYTGNIQSNFEFNHLQNQDFEATDFILLDNGLTPYLINFQTSVIDNDTDTFSFTIHKHSTLALVSVDDTDSLKVYAGQSKAQVLAPVNLKQPPVSALPALTVTDVIVNEEDQSAEFTVFLNHPPAPNKTVTLNVFTQDMTASSGSDYNAVNTNLTFNSDEVMKKVNIELIDDCQAEPAESFKLIFENIVGATINNTVLTASIVDTDSSYSNIELEEFGYISVAQFNVGQPNDQAAKPNDGIDDTQAIQAAIDKAITEGKNVYFPQGDWQVSDTLKGMMTVSEVAPGKWKQDNRQHPTSLIGSSCAGKRPKIVLKPTDSSFDNPATNFTRKPVVWLYSQKRDNGSNSFYETPTKGSIEPQHHQSSISFNQIIRGIDFDLSSANSSGAIAIRHPGSQGCSISDVSVDLGLDQNQAYSAFDNPPGQGGGLYNVKVTGGRYAVTTNSDVRYPVIVGAEFIDQSIAAIDLSAFSSLVMTGFHIKSRFFSNGILISNFCSGCGFANNLNLVDGLIDLGQGESIAIRNEGDKSIYLDNVYFRGTSTYKLFHGQNTPELWYDGETLHAKNYIYFGKNTARSDSGLLDLDAPGQQRGSIIAIDAAASVHKLISKHIWDDFFPTFEDDDVVNAESATDINGIQYTLGTADDTVALQNLINDHQKVFLPSGSYNVSNSLHLRKDSVLIGAEKHATKLRAVGNWPKGEPIIKLDPLLSAQEAKEATTVVSRLSLISSGGVQNAMRKNAFLHWTAGRNSMIRDISIGTETYQGTALSTQEISNTPAFHIYETGGGRWYGIFGEWTFLKFNSGAPGYRALKIENTKDYAQPLQIYGLNVERSRSNPQMEIDHAKNVSIYSLKTESNDGPKAEDKANDVLHINNSENINVIGLTGRAGPTYNIVKVTNSNNLKLINVSSVIPRSDYAAINTDYFESISGSKNAYLIDPVP